MSYTPHTSEDIKEMLAKIGKNTIEELFESVPENLRIKKEYNIPEEMTEIEVTKLLAQLASKNNNMEQNTCFMGAGVYDHFIPVLVDNLSSRSEFWTAYTPYQPEASQGNLQAIFEYQTAICEVTGMDISNASLYDGPSALAEAVLLTYAHFRNKKKVFFLPETLHPEYSEVTKTYAANLDIELLTIPQKDGAIDIEKLREMLHDKVAAVVVQSPNLYGGIEDLKEIVTLAHDVKALTINIVNPISLGLLKAPGTYGVDIVVGDGQTLGIPMGYGGPSFAFLSAKKEFLRRIPGRIVGKTVDERGDTGYALTIQTREQHIKREKATSNICTNQALMALRGLIYLSCLGKEGFSELAEHCFQKAHYLSGEIEKLEGYKLSYNTPFFNEFVITCPKPAQEIFEALREKNIYAGVPLERWFPERKNEILIAVTECRTKEEMDNFVVNLKSVAG